MKNKEALELLEKLALFEFKRGVAENQGWVGNVQFWDREIDKLRRQIAKLEICQTLPSKT